MATATAARNTKVVDNTNEDSLLAKAKAKAVQHGPAFKKGAAEIGRITIAVLIADAIWTGIQHTR